MRRVLAISVLAFLWGCTTLAPLPPPANRLAIRGHIVTPERVIRNGWIVVEGGRIASIGEAKPEVGSAAVVETDDYVFPTFVDLHNHPMYNVFPRWSPPQQYPNRYAWRNLDDYKAKIAVPFGKLLDNRKFCEMNEFAEVQMLIAGTGATTGIGPPRDGMPQCIVGLVRNLDWASGFHGAQPGNERVRTLIGVTSDIRPVDEERVRRMAADMKAGRVDAVVIHLAEGKRSDPDTQAEFAALAKWDLLAPQAVLVHAIALGEKEFSLMPAGASLVWSPRSNFELYGETLDVRAALARGIPVALGPDWAPTGSINMLEELRYARNYSRQALADGIGSKQLFEMATLVPARIAKVDNEIGSLAVGKRADLFVARSRDPDAYESLAASPVTDISLVMIDGVPIYGESGRLAALRVEAIEPIPVCGAARALNAGSLVAGPFAGVVASLSKLMQDLNVRLGPLADCPP